MDYTSNQKYIMNVWLAYSSVAEQWNQQIDSTWQPCIKFLLQEEDAQTPEDAITQAEGEVAPEYDNIIQTFVVHAIKGGAGLESTPTRTT